MGDEMQDGTATPTTQISDMLRKADMNEKEEQVVYTASNNLIFIITQERGKRKAEEDAKRASVAKTLKITPIFGSKGSKLTLRNIDSKYVLYISYIYHINTINRVFSFSNPPISATGTAFRTVSIPRESHKKSILKEEATTSIATFFVTLHNNSDQTFYGLISFLEEQGILMPANPLTRNIKGSSV